MGKGKMEGRSEEREKGKKRREEWTAGKVRGIHSQENRPTESREVP